MNARVFDEQTLLRRCVAAVGSAAIRTGAKVVAPAVRGEVADTGETCVHVDL